MTISCTDFTDNILNLLVGLGVLNCDDFEPDDPGSQSEAATAAIRKLADNAGGRKTPATRTIEAVSLCDSHSRAARFMRELLDAHETLTEIAEQKGARTLADCMYMLSALQKGSIIEVHHPSESLILEVIQDLPSESVWMAHVHQVAA
jgi:hypothetical protein